MTRSRIVTRWMLVILALAACGTADAASVRIEKRTEVLKSEALGGREATIHTPVFHGIKAPAVLKALQESIADGVKQATDLSPEEWVREWKEAAAVEKAIQENRLNLKEYEMTEEVLVAVMAPAVESHFTAESLDRFRLDEKGITFVYDFGFPHVSEALEPSGEYFVSWKELRPFVNPEGPLSRLQGLR